jgi:type III restriction enzyme
MAGIELFDFQQAAVSGLLEACLAYFEQGQDRFGGRDVPFIGQLKAVTGAGKTPILASVLGRMDHSLVLWTTKYGSVVQQTADNLRLGGKYHHLLGDDVEVFNFSEVKSPDQWCRILEKENGVTVLVSTVAAWNSAEKDDRLNVHKVAEDWGDKSRWDQLKFDRRRRLWVVYDEAHNQTDEQIDQLDDLNPAGFFVASASQIGGKLQQYLSMLAPEVRQQRIVTVPTRAVVDAQLLKSTLSIADYDSSAEEMIADAAARRAELESRLAAAGANVTPKAIYVVEASNVAALEEGADPRPVGIWKTLVNDCGVKPENIAIATNTRAKDLPKDAVMMKTIDQLTDDHTHIIFNKKLQEGWDDPSVYVCYFDGRTDSPTRIQQVVGRALRQPSAKHLDDDDLNTAYFFIACPNELLDKITDKLKEELRIYKDADDDDFEPVRVVEAKKAPAKIPLKPEWAGKLTVPLLTLEMPPTGSLKKAIEQATFEFGDADLAAPGRALVNVVSVKTGEVSQQARDLLEDMKVRCGYYLQDQIKVQNKNCLGSIHLDTFKTPPLRKRACYKSKALAHYHDLAEKVVRLHESQVMLTEDPADPLYAVKPYQPSGTVNREFDHAAHPHYDAKTFNDDELEMAKALDKWGQYVWVRNKDRVDYGIPLPSKSASSSTFYPDFLWWVKGTVWAIDPTGKFILEEKLRTKLLNVPKPLKIALVTRGELDAGFKLLSSSGWSLLFYRHGNVVPQNCTTLDEVLTILEAHSEDASP